VLSAVEKIAEKAIARVALGLVLGAQREEAMNICLTQTLIFDGLARK